MHSPPKGHPEREGGAFAGRGSDIDSTTHHGHELVANGQPQAGTAVLACYRAIHLLECAKEAGHLGVAHADAGVADFEAQMRLLVPNACGADGDEDLPLLGEFDGVTG